MKKIILSVITILITFFVNAQNIFPANGAAGIGTNTPNASSLLEIKSTTKGILIPRMTKIKRDAIASPAEGLMIYQTNSTPGFYYYDGVSWKAISPKGVNKTLSNLTAPTAINVDLLPETDKSVDLGSASKSWKNIYFDSSIYVGGIRFAGKTGTDSYFGSNTLISNTTGHDNTAIGNTALNLNTTGYYNTAVGAHALASNTTAFYNTAVGFEALFSTATGGNNTALGMEALHDNTGSYNTAVGTNSLNKNTTGIHNTATGFYALLYNTTGDYNTALGSEALQYNSTGYENTAAGYEALLHNTTGYVNTAYGNYSLQSNTTGFANSASGNDALNANTTGIYNVANGYRSLYSNTTGSANTAQGYRALFSNTTGYSNVAIGSRALYNNSTQNNLVAVGDSALYNNDGAGNTAIGSKTLYTNTTGYYNTANGYQALFSNTSGYENTANGYWTLYFNTTGHHNTANGYDALYFNSTGAYNTANGFYSLQANTIGDRNTAIGYGSGSLNDGNTNCSFFGYDADQTIATDFTNSMALGNSARITASNQVRIGNSSVTSIGGYAGWSNISDVRVKKNIKENVPGLEFINKLKPVTYNLNVTGLKSFLKEELSDDKTEGENKNASDKSKALIEQGIQQKEKVLYTGFVAQDVEAVAKKLNYDFSGVDKPQDENGLYGLRYAEFVVPLVKAVQQLSKMNDDKDAKIDNLQKQIDELKAIVLSGNTKTGTTENINQQKVELSGAVSLSQNIPNPFTNSTLINYYLPVNDNNAYINFYGVNGTLLKSVKLSGNGKGNISVKAKELSSGAYKYALMIDGKVIDSKSMILSK